MLSKSEIEYLKNPESVDANYARVLKHRIRGKMQALRAELSVLNAAGFVSVTEKPNAITEFCNLNKAAFSSPGEIRTLVGGSKARYA